MRSPSSVGLYGRAVAVATVSAPLRWCGQFANADLSRWMAGKGQGWYNSPATGLVKEARMIVLLLALQAAQPPAEPPGECETSASEQKVPTFQRKGAAGINTVSPARNLGSLKPILPNMNSQTESQSTIADARARLARAERALLSFNPAPGKPTKEDAERSVDRVRSLVDQAAREAESQDRTGTFCVRDQMKQYYKSNSVISRLLKAIRDMEDTLIGKI